MLCSRHGLGLVTCLSLGFGDFAGFDAVFCLQQCLHRKPGPPATMPFLQNHVRGVVLSPKRGGAMAQAALHRAELCSSFFS